MGNGGNEAMNDKYIGHPSQISGVEEFSLLKGKGKGMTILEVRNGNGLQMSLSADRAMDIARIFVDGVNMGYFAPCGYVAPAYYDNRGLKFLKSFTAGFITTCGFGNVGSPCEDDGEELPLHGTISHTPCDFYSYNETDDEIIVTSTVRDASIFADQLLLERKYICKKAENKIILEDTIKNIGSKKSPCMLLYHINIGYPLLSENAKVNIPAKSAIWNSEVAKRGFDDRLKMEKPQRGYAEQCFYYDVIDEDGICSVSIFNPDINKGLKISYDKSTLDSFTEWKMMGEKDYVLGLEPGNCNPDGRCVVRKEGKLKELNPNEEYKTRVVLEFVNSENDF